MNGPTGQPMRTFFQCVEINKKLYILSNPDYKLPAANLLVFDLSNNKLVAYNTSILATRLFYPSGNQLWISTYKGLFMLNALSENLQSILLRPLDDSLHIPKGIYVSYIYKDRQNNIWLTTVKGVYRIKKNGGTSLFSTENGFTTNLQTSVFQDYENNMWFTNEQTGLTKLSNQQLAYYPVLKPNFTPSDIFIHPSNDSVWMHDDDHHRLFLLLPNGETEEWTCPTESLPSSSRFVSANGLWLLSGNSIYWLKVKPNSKQYSLSLFVKDSANSFGFNCGTRDMKGNLVTVSSKLTVFAGKKMISQPLHYLADGLTIDKNNHVWVAPRSDQLLCFEISGTGNDTKLSLLKTFQSVVPGSPRSIVADRSGNIWIGTRDQGLFCLHFDGLNLLTTRQVTTKNGLSENFVNYLFCDEDNNVWACTHSGLDRIKMSNDHFLVENVTRSNNLFFPIAKIQQTSKGLFWILSEGGIITYDPSRIHTSDWRPQLSFSDIVVNNEEHTGIAAKKEFSHSQNNLFFQLSAPTFIDEKQTRFSYLLEGGSNKSWSDPSANASINFVNLPPGEYRLRVKGIFLHGLYPDTESSYSFTILPPWWQTWWFRLSLALLILGLLLLGLRYYINRKLQLQRVLLEKRRAVEKERTRIATDMHDDLGAGLSQIKFLSEAIGIKKQQHLPIEEDISNIRAFSIEMIGKMGEIVWALNEKNDTLSDLLSYTRSYAVEYLEQNGIACQVEEPDDIPQDYVSSEFRRNIYLTVKETLHNIVKHAQATEVFMNIQITDMLTIQIKDNGIGINNTTRRPFGNGLINMNLRIRELRGQFEIVGNGGTEVNIMVPLNQ
jgi:streptogramin lyase